MNDQTAGDRTSHDAPAAFHVHNGQAFDLSAMPAVSMNALREAVLSGVAAGGRIAAMFAMPEPFAASAAGGQLRMIVAIADGRRGRIRVVSAPCAERYRALTPECPQAHWFERELAEQWGIVPLGHPWIKPIRFEPPRRGVREAPPIGATDFFTVGGAEVHEVAVGPVHAGVIEPGHFRFQCHGETVHHLEISLGYQHRGVERAMIGGPGPRSVHYAETLAGDTTVGHAAAYALAVEGLAGCRTEARAQAILGVAMELERVANHVGDLGALAGDVGFLPTMSYCGRIRGDVLNASAAICGNRFGRGLVRPGGVGMDIDDETVADLLRRVEAICGDAREAIELLWDSPSVMGRFEDTGRLTAETAERIGLVGPAARASGLQRDARQEFPHGIYCFAQIPVSTWKTGDVFARAYVRWMEIQRSLDFVGEQLRSLPRGPVCQPCPPPAPSSAVVAVTEGWRGEICHVVVTDHRGRFAAYKVVDPSFHNWFGLAMAMRNQQISDFPLCNKSFNMSYCGHDL
jgi:Ni,Fe-hydrogenase III large subunit